MLDIVVYDDIKKNIKDIDDTINKIFVNYEIDYHIHKFTNLDQNLKDIINDDSLLKIYIIDINMNNDCWIDILKYIRNIDPFGIIIFVTKYKKYLYSILDNKLMVLDFIIKCDNYLDRLKDDIDKAITILFNQKAFVFKYKNVFYRISYKQINYIEKEPSIKRCIVHTTFGNFYIVSSLNKLLNVLDKNFMRVHQSCIININNVFKVDLSNNYIIFKNGDMTNLLSDKAKKEAKKYVDIF